MGLEERAYQAVEVVENFDVDGVTTAFFFGNAHVIRLGGFVEKRELGVRNGD